MKKIIAAWDFDGTIIHGDSLFLFAKHCLSWPKYYLALLRFSPYAFLYIFKIIDRPKAKEKLLTYFYKGYSQAYIQAKAESFTDEIDKHSKPEAMQRIAWHRRQGHYLILVSASVDMWLQPWAEKNGFENVIATRLETSKQHLTGRYQGANCNGPEKRTRLLEAFPDRSSYLLYAYGDTEGDKELLQEADYPFFRCYSEKN